METKPDDGKIARFLKSNPSSLATGVFGVVAMVSGVGEDVFANPNWWDALLLGGGAMFLLFALHHGVSPIITKETALRTKIKYTIYFAVNLLIVLCISIWYGTQRGKLIETGLHQNLWVKLA